MNSYYSDTLYPLQDKVLQVIDTLKTPFYLTGGTALSRCFFNHRYSEDLDLFVNKDPKFVTLADGVLAGLGESFEVEIVLKSESYFLMKVNTILKVEMVNDVAFKYGKVVKKGIFSQVDNVTNILSNKISAVISRDEPKDVVDIWVISKNTKVDWQGIFQAVGSKTFGIFAPDVAQRLTDFPMKWLDRIKWVEGKQPDPEQFRQDINDICDAMLKLK